ncbi:DUF262 domain-containing protein [Fibrella aquatilis]|uniref:DUF262 domain-containing protein n=1 Tax=Fibrella aquatilis TaxID=2817059 RepID=A0A939GAW2_9BACT|nr:DUF262 domain-containing protein [Fibrella aquatilis]MBO0933291.1 DUF262 domain-containing protein [Fibrella aquatilis]
MISLFDSGELNLNPPYQRGDIWSPIAKRKLIDSIKHSYPLPAFFIYRNVDGQFEMVDGQQRTRAILGYHKGYFPDMDKLYIQEIDANFFYSSYQIAVYIISETNESEIEDFYYRVNKYGTKLNRPEIARAQYSSTQQQNLVEKLSTENDFTSLNLFTDATLKRLNDTDLVAELLTLQKLGNTDKKIQVEKRFYENIDFTEQDARALEEQFGEVLVHFQRFNAIYPLNRTRYKQRNDFYTLYGFLKDNVNLERETLDYFYKILVLIGEDIYPSNERCYSFREYANNCVSQSNSKRARDERSKFLNDLLLNVDEHPLSRPEDDPDVNFVILDLLTFYNLNDDSLTQQGLYWLVNLGELERATGRNYF